MAASAEAFITPAFKIVVELQISSCCVFGFQMVQTSVSFMFVWVMWHQMNLWCRFGHQMCRIWYIFGQPLLWTCHWPFWSNLLSFSSLLPQLTCGCSLWLPLLSFHSSPACSASTKWIPYLKCMPQCAVHHNRALYVSSRLVFLCQEAQCLILPAPYRAVFQAFPFGFMHVESRQICGRRIFFSEHLGFCQVVSTLHWSHSLPAPEHLQQCTVRALQ